MTDKAESFQIDASGAQGVVVGDRNVMVNNYLSPAPGARLNPETFGVFSPDVVADEVRKMTAFDVVSSSEQRPRRVSGWKQPAPGESRPVVCGIVPSAGERPAR